MARTTIDVVDRGAEPSGTAPINDVLAAAHGPDRELYFPPGRYRLNPITFTGSNWAIVGDDATLVVPGHVRRSWLSAWGADWEIEGFTVDLRAEGAAPSVALTGTDWEFRNVVFRGTTSDPAYGGPGADGALLYPTVTEPGGTGLVENVQMADGSAAIGEASNRSGIRIGAENRGHLILRSLRMEKWGDDTLHAEPSAGPITIEDSVFRRTNVGVRVGGDALVRNCVFVQDDEVPIQSWSGEAHGRGLWLNADGRYPGPILVDDCDFTMTGHAAGDAITNEHDVEHLTVRNCSFRLTGDRKAIDLVRGWNRVTIDGMDVTGMAVPPAIQVSGDGTATDVCAPHGYDDVRGLAATDVQASDDCLAPRTSIERGLDESFAHLRIATRPDPNYEFVVDGTVRAGPDADVGDVVTRREDGTTTVAGFVGYDDADDYYVKGSVTNFRFIHRDPTVELDGHSADLAEQPWELRPPEEPATEERAEPVEPGDGDERGEPRERDVDEQSGDRVDLREDDEPGRRRVLPRYAGGGRGQGRRIRGPGGNWSG